MHEYFVLFLNLMFSVQVIMTIYFNVKVVKSPIGKICLKLYFHKFKCHQASGLLFALFYYVNWMIRKIKTISYHDIVLLKLCSMEAFMNQTLPINLRHLEDWTRCVMYVNYAYCVLLYEETLISILFRIKTIASTIDYNQCRYTSLVGLVILFH